MKETLLQYEVSNYEIDRVEVGDGGATALEKFRRANEINLKPVF